MEIGRFQEHVGSRFGYARIQTAKYTADTHGFGGVTDHQVAIGKGAGNPVKRNEGSTFGLRLYNHFTAGYLCRIESVQRLTKLVKYVICNIYNIIDRAQTDNVQPVL